MGHNRDDDVEQHVYQLTATEARLNQILNNQSDTTIIVDDLRLSDSNAIMRGQEIIKGKDVITEPKTVKGKRVIALPDFLVEKLNDYTAKLYGIMPNDRMFHITKSYLEHEMIRGVKESGVKKIRLHDIRHSHASLLISKLGASPQLVADRLGHEKIVTTLQTYSHLYPDQSRDLADQLEELNEQDEDGGD